MYCALRTVEDVDVAGMVTEKTAVDMAAFAVAVACAAGEAVLTTFVATGAMVEPPPPHPAIAAAPMPSVMSRILSFEMFFIILICCAYCTGRAVVVTWTEIVVVRACASLTVIVAAPGATAVIVTVVPLTVAVATDGADETTAYEPV